MSSKRQPQTENRPVQPDAATQATVLAEEIERIQALLRRMDGMLDPQADVSLKDLAQAIAAADAGGRSVAQLRKLEKELARAMNDEDYELARKSMFEMIAKLRRHIEKKVPVQLKLL